MTSSPPAEHPSDSTSDSTMSKATHAVGWNYLSFFLGKLLIAITISILARLLTPAQMGIVFSAMIIIDYFTIVQDLGLGAALIQRRGDIEAAAHTVFTMNLIFSMVVTLVIFIAAPLVGRYFEESTVTPVLRLLGCTFVINALGSIHTVRLRRELDFRKKLIPDLARAFTKGVVSIGLALAGVGVWSLVWGQLAGTVAFVVLAWKVLPWRPRLQLNIPLLKPLLRYGASVLVTDSVSAGIDNLDYLIVGRVFDSAAFGIYSSAYRLPQLLIINNLWTVSAVIFPTYAKFQHDLDELRRAFLLTVRFVSLVAVPICLGLIIAADALIRVYLGDQWLDAIPLTRILALYALVLSIGFHAGGVYKAIGRPDISARLSVLSLALLVPSLLIGVQFGLAGVAVGHLVAVIIRTIIRLAIARHFIHVSLRAIFYETKPALQGALGLALLALPTLYLSRYLPALPQLLLVAAAGGAGYIGTLWIFERATIMAVLNTIDFSKLRRSSATA